MTYTPFPVVVHPDRDDEVDDDDCSVTCQGFTFSLCLVLGPVDPIPPGLPAGVVIVRTA